MNIQQEVIRLVEEIIIDSEDQVTPGTSLVDDLNADSIDCIELVMAVEDEFDIEIPDEEGEKVKTIQDLIDLVERLRK